ncbi:MAG: PAS domain S-box protein [Nitrospiraceae bacterium]|nr:PAS domain S-box protein [Nitrospiraceae bacterium]
MAHNITAVLIFALSILFQLAASVYALLLIKITGRKTAWILIAAAMLLMAVRRILSFIQHIISGPSISFSVPEFIAFIISCLMLFGVTRIGNYFRSINAADQKLKETEERYRLFLDHFHGIAYQGTLFFKPVFLHGAVEPITGYKEEDFIAGRLRWDEIIHPDDLVKISKSIEDIRTKPCCSLEREYRILAKNKKVKWLREHVSNICDSSGNPLFVQGVLYDITRQKETEKILYETETAYNLMFMNNPHPMWIYDLETLAFLDVNNSAIEKYGYTKDEFLSMTIKDIRPSDDIPRLLENVSQVDNGLDIAGTWRHRKKDGKILDVEIISHTIDFAGRRAEVVLAHDLTEHKKLEARLLHAQKIEAIGQLAAGIAHDFNNILTAIIGYASLLKIKTPKGSPLLAYVDPILASTDRAANLTKRLLTFGRKQTMDILPVHLNEIIKELESLLGRLIGENIDLRTELTDEDIVILADIGQVEQVFVNLATNARDAMPNGGRIVIGTDIVTIDDRFIDMYRYAKPGAYARILFSDTGAGMDEVTTKKIFEPFFTTKDVDKGTGLGLSIVYGIVKQHNGYIHVSSEPSKGTTFQIYFPLEKIDVAKSYTKELSAPVHGEGTIILLAEDDKPVRDLIFSVLKEFDYKVLSAENGEEAVNIFNKNKDRIKLVLLDLIMPGKSGKEAFYEMKAIKPDIKAIFMSGYPMDIIKRNQLFQEGQEFVSKPISPTEILNTVKKTLEKIK